VPAGHYGIAALGTLLLWQASVAGDTAEQACCDVQLVSAAEQRLQLVIVPSFLNCLVPCVAALYAYLVRPVLLCAWCRPAALSHATRCQQGRRSSSREATPASG
jgi:hypothetical protein